MKLFTKFLGWTPAEVEVFLVGVRRELDDRSIHMTNEAYASLYSPFLRKISSC